MHLEDPTKDHKDIESFITNYDMLTQSNSRNTLTMLYFSLTTLSSVGFGDYSPQTTPERAFIVCVFFMQLIVFSSIVNSLQSYFEDYQAKNEDPDESSKLMKFFQFLKRYNNGVKLEHKFRHRVEHYFENFWADHRMVKITYEQND